MPASIRQNRRTTPPQNYYFPLSLPILSASGYPQASFISCKIWRKATGRRRQRRCLSHLTQPCVLVFLYNTDTFFDVGDKIFHDLNFILLCVSLNIHIWDIMAEFMVKKFANGKFDCFPFWADQGEIEIVKFVHKPFPDMCRAQLLIYVIKFLSFYTSHCALLSLINVRL